MPASRATWAALDADRARRAATSVVTQVLAVWSWRYDGRLYYIRRPDGETVGTVSFIPGAVEHESAALDNLVAYLNQST